ncbi:MAG: aminotransferase class I/II-fold pyridoxal phosphate-dependent enzyme, partial [Planctomycetes bacterium]|nr:aminotransferase class I/II-fold pyridoxal phosphate-dependent enzyme [Planctomycetota bacterium]
AFGIPGVRIGWIVGPPEFVADCWANNDYISIGPNMLGDMVAQVAVKKANSKKLFGRTHTLLRENLTVMKRWLDSFDGFFKYIEPQAGAFVFVKYQSDIPSVDLAERIRRNQDVLVVPGIHFGAEGYLRISLGVERDTLSAALVRIKNELETLRTPSPNAKP